MIKSLLTQLPFFVCFFWFLFFALQRKSSYQKSRDLLAIFMLIAASMHISHIVYFTEAKSFYLYFDWLFLLSSLLVAPSYYLYVVSITKGPIKKIHLLNYLPAILFISLYFIMFFHMSASDKKMYLDILMSENKPKPDFSQPAHRITFLFIVNRLIFFSQTLFYIFTTYSVIKQFGIRVKNHFSNSEGKELRWIVTLTISIFIISIFATIFNIWGRAHFRDNNFILSLPSLLFTAILFLIGTIGNAQKFTIQDLESEELENNIIESENTQPSLIRTKLEDLIHEKKVFLTKDLRISDLCKELNTNRTYLSQVFNEELKENFNTYINKHRVNYAISLLNKDEWKHYSLDKFSELSGFGSTISMIRAFKQCTGKTPREYRL